MAILRQVPIHLSSPLTSLNNPGKSRTKCTTGLPADLGGISRNAVSEFQRFPKYCVTAGKGQPLQFFHFGFA